MSIVCSIVSSQLYHTIVVDSYLGVFRNVIDIVNSIIATEVVVGLTQPAYVVTEGDTVMVCAQLQSGQLERSVTVIFSTSFDPGIYTCIQIIQLAHSNDLASLSSCFKQYCSNNSMKTFIIGSCT